MESIHLQQTSPDDGLNQGSPTFLKLRATAHTAAATLLSNMKGNQFHSPEHFLTWP